MKKIGLWEVKGNILNSKDKWEFDKTVIVICDGDFKIAAALAEQALKQRFNTKNAQVQSVIFDSHGMLAPQK